MSRRGIVRGLVLAVLLGAAYLLVARSSHRAPVVTPLAPWTAGSSLRETFESFPPTGDDTAELRLIRGEKSERAATAIRRGPTTAATRRGR